MVVLSFAWMDFSQFFFENCLNLREVTFCFNRQVLGRNLDFFKKKIIQSLCKWILWKNGCMHIGFLLNHKSLIHIPSNNLPTTNYPPTTHRKMFILQNKHSWENKTISVFYVFDEYNLSFITLKICKSKLTEDLMFIL